MYSSRRCGANFWSQSLIICSHCLLSVKETALASKAYSTIRSYLAGFKRWKLRASSNYLCHMSANSFHVAVSLKCLILEANSPLPVLNAVYSIDWAQQLAGLPKRSEYPMVSSLIAASQRILGRPKSNKKPISPEMLKAVVISRIPDKSPSLSLCLVGYAGFFPFQRDVVCLLMCPYF